MLSVSYLFFIISSVVVLAYRSDCESEGNFFAENNNDEYSKKTFRLPDAVEPQDYDLMIAPSFANFLYEGSLIIRIKIIRPTYQIILHSKDLEINSMELTSPYGRKYSVIYQLTPENDFLNVTTENKYSLSAGSIWSLSIKFRGKLNDDMVGFYRSSYKDGNTTKWLAVTQFEPTYARRAFPCFDEPGFKANFWIRLVTEPQYFVMSNMPKKGTTTVGSKKVHEFQKTPLMSTYLVAFMVAESNVIMTDELNKYSVWARANAIQDSAYALYIGPKFLAAMASYTSIPYAFPKMDLVALPDFSMGAMENWGMVTFRERAMQYNEYINSDMDKQQTAVIIAHETVHQWFGNYITPYWWDYLWLNEGFAQYFQYKITGMVQPDWRIEDYFVTYTMQPVLFEDGANVNHAMTTPVLTPTEIERHFDIITYSKGASVLRMLEHMVSPEIFRNAIIKYLQNRYKVNSLAKPDDLWSEFEGQLGGPTILPSNINITDTMTRWTTYTGYPLLTVSREKQSQQSVIIEQVPYNASYRSSLKEVSNEKNAWVVPISYTTHSKRNFINTQPTVWLVPGQKTVIKEQIPSDQWIILNLQQTGYYRVNYAPENWQLLIQQLKNDPIGIHTLNRAQLLDDSWTLAEDNIIPYNVPFELTSYLSKEVDAVPWFTAIRHFDYVYSLFENTDVKDLLREFIADTLQFQYNRVGFYVKESDDHLTKVLRTPLISLACRLNVADCNEYAEQIYKKNIFDLSKIPASVKTTVFCAALTGKKYRLSDVWSSLWKLYSESNSAHEKDALLYAAACVKCSHHLKMYLQKLINQKDGDIRQQDHISVYRAVLSTSQGVTAALQFVDDLAKNLTSVQPHEMQVFLQIIKRTKTKITNQKQIDILEKQYATAKKYESTGDLIKKYVKALEDSYKLALERVKRIQHKQKEIGALLSARIKSNSNTLAPSMSSLIIMFVGWLIYLQS